jgi:[pyruvate, water dikinase]-phosphate phosphotransferase / [pyruvate, water dikinase] kinase
MLTVFVVSDATGDTAQRMLRAGQVRAVVREARGSEAIIIHTLVSDELRRVMRADCRIQGVDALDIMGPVLERLAVHLQIAPQEKPGLFQTLAEAKSREIEAVAFAFRHDDGQNVDTLGRAEVVLVGISRTMKTPTTLYLAYRGWFSANVPLVPGVPPPKTLVEMPFDRVFCLTMVPEKLQELRRARAEEDNIPIHPYTSLDQIRTELAYMDELCRKYHWHRIGTTGKSVEEVAREIIGILEEG